MVAVGVAEVAMALEVMVEEAEAADLAEGVQVAAVKAVAAKAAAEKEQVRAAEEAMVRAIAAGA